MSASFSSKIYNNKDGGIGLADMCSEYRGQKNEPGIVNYTESVTSESEAMEGS